ncbi:MAG: hypothetical protein ACO2OZ_09635 [Acidilobaceae archaeon]
MQHLTTIMRRLWRTPKRLRWILLAETRLHISNPWISVIATLLLVYQAARNSTMALALVALGTVLLACKPNRTWTAIQLY